MRSAQALIQSQKQLKDDANAARRAGARRVTGISESIEKEQERNLIFAVLEAMPMMPNEAIEI